jgi:hypothetical protein
MINESFQLTWYGAGDHAVREPGAPGDARRAGRAAGAQRGGDRRGAQPRGRRGRCALRAGVGHAGGATPLARKRKKAKEANRGQAFEARGEERLGRKRFEEEPPQTNPLALDYTPFHDSINSSLSLAASLSLSACVCLLSLAHSRRLSVFSLCVCVSLLSLSRSLSHSLTRAQLGAAATALAAYLDRFRTRLSAGNRRHLQTMLLLARSFLKAVDGASASPACSAASASASASASTSAASASASASTSAAAAAAVAANPVSRILRLNAFLFEAGIDNINLIRLQRYVRDSKVLFKVSSYGDAAAAAAGAGGGGRSPPQLAALHAFAGLVGAVTQPR